MLRKTPENPQVDLFANVTNFINGKALNLYEDDNAWHNVFRREVTSRINEEVFSPLFSEGTGRPNASIRVMIAMMILKEAEGMSDQKLFEHCRFNLLFSSALGLINMTDSIPTESTYYLFRKSVAEYDKKHKTNLYEEMFAKLTKDQALKFEVSGKSIRMDSKLIGSNIAWSTRYELIHRTLELCFNEVKDDVNLSKEVKDRLNKLLETQSNKVVYRNTTAEVKSLTLELGSLIIQLLKLNNYSELESFKTLLRVFNEHYKIVEEKIELRDKADISTDSVQSPHDTDCSYRIKGDGKGHNVQKVKGYSVNITETCDEGKLNLITDITVAPATAADNDFLKDAIENTQNIICDKTENIHADGAYHSPNNQEFCDSNNMELYLNAIQGTKGRYDLTLNPDNTLTITDLSTGLIIDNVQITTDKGEIKWRIKSQVGYRYFNQNEVNACQLRKKTESTPREILEKRNNVEATIFQLSFHCKKAKTRYRGLTKHKMWAAVRCIWINFVRILNNVAKPSTVISKNDKNSVQTNPSACFFTLIKAIRQAICKISSHIPLYKLNYQPVFQK